MAIHRNFSKILWFPLWYCRATPAMWNFTVQKYAILSKFSNFSRCGSLQVFGIVHSGLLSLEFLRSFCNLSASWNDVYCFCLCRQWGFGGCPLFCLSSNCCACLVSNVLGVHSSHRCCCCLLWDCTLLVGLFVFAHASLMSESLVVFPKSFICMNSVNSLHALPESRATSVQTSLAKKNYGAATLSWHVKNEKNSAVLQTIVMGLALINFVHEGASHTSHQSHRSMRKYWNRKHNTFFNPIPFAFSGF